MGVLPRLFAEIVPAATFTCRYCMPYEEMTIHVCRRPRLPLAEAWPRIKSYG